MTGSSNWQLMKQHAFEAFKNKGRLDVHELEEIIQLGSANGDFDEHEKTVLINIISNLTRADLNDAVVGHVIEECYCGVAGDHNLAAGRVV